MLGPKSKWHRCINYKRLVHALTVLLEHTRQMVLPTANTSDFPAPNGFVFGSSFAVVLPDVNGRYQEHKSLGFSDEENGSSPHNLLKQN
jgi:hypothetical protein